MKQYIIGLLIICTLLFSCERKEVSSVAEYSKWINNPANGLIATRKINGLQISVKYLPAEYLEYKDIQEDEDSKKQVDDIKKEYKNSITFLMTIGPDEEKGNKNDIMFDRIKNYKEYSERLLSLNFAISDNIQLKAGDVILKPVLSALENTYGLSKNRNIVFAFAPSETEKQLIESCSELDFTYADELFQLGYMHFTFKENNFKKLPTINQCEKINKI